MTTSSTRSTLVFLLSFLASLQLFVEPAKAADFNITPRGNDIPYFGKSYGDVWGDGDIACLGIYQGYSNTNTPFGVGIYSITNPAAPVLLSIYTSPETPIHNQFEHGALRNNIGYFGSWNGGGVHIVSLTNPSTPVRLSRITATTTGLGYVTNGFDRVHTVFLERDFLYEAAHVEGILSVKVFNISNPFLPTFVRNIVTTNTIKVHQITAETKGTNIYLYTSGWGNSSSGATPGQTDIWDVTDIGTQPAQWKGRVFSGSNSHSSWPTPDGNSLVVCRETAGGEVTIYDISNPSAPSVQFVIRPSTIGLENSLPHNPVVVGNILFISWYQNGIQAFDIADRTRPRRIGSYDTYAFAGTLSFQGNWGVFPFLGLNKLLLSDMQSGLHIMNASGILTGTNNYAPLLISSPTNQLINQGGTATFSADFTGSSLSYQWRHAGTNVPGATASSYTVFNAQTNQSGAYTLRAFNTSGSVTSAPATLSLILNDTPPSITAHPQSVAVYPEQSATLSVAVLGGTPMYFQWRFRDHDLANATNSSLTIPSVGFSDAGDYSVIAYNNYGAVLSSNASIILIDSPYINGVTARPGARSAIISWNTQLPTDGIVDFGPFSEGSITGSSPRDPVLATNHSVLLTGLTPGTTYNFQAVSRAGGTNYLSAVYQFTTQNGQLVLDNSDPSVTFTGAWTVSSATAGYVGTNYAFANTNSSANAFATYTPDIPFAGKYDIEVSYTIGGNRSQTAPYTISHANGTGVVTKNQQSSIGLWNPLATEIPFTLGKNGFVRLANNASPSVVMADAVRFTYSAGQPPIADGTFPAWWSGFYLGSNVNPNIDHDGDGFSTGQEYILGTAPNSSAHKLNVRVFRSGANANVIFHPCYGDRIYTLQQRASLTGSTWQSATFNSFSPSAEGEGVFSLSLTGATENYYRISVELNTNAATLARSAVVQERRMFRGSLDEPACGPGRIYAE